MQEHKHVIHIFQEAKKAAQNNDTLALKQLSNQTIHSSAIYHDTDNILVAIVLYALSKLIERKDMFSEIEYKKYLNYYFNTIDESIECISKNKCDIFRSKIGGLSDIKGLSGDLRRSVEDVFRKARINKASKIYEHGISMETTAKLLGISLWELAEYSGQTSISDGELNKTVDIKKRVKMAMEFFS
ncbi:MAG: hypothetical protein QXI33_02120 [Candidatus Pacearchaeota archaeon]